MSTFSTERNLIFFIMLYYFSGPFWALSFYFNPRIVLNQISLGKAARNIRTPHWPYLEPYGPGFFLHIIFMTYCNITFPQTYTRLRNSAFHYGCSKKLFNFPMLKPHNHIAKARLRWSNILMNIVCITFEKKHKKPTVGYTVFLFFRTDHRILEL
jgi:hypothetical protein